MNFKKFFRKKERCPIHDKYFVEIQWSDDFSPKQAEVQSVLEKVDRDNHWKTPIVDSLPYMTYRQVETLFKQFKSSFIESGTLEQIVIKRLSIVYQDKVGKYSSSNEAFANDLVIDSSYQNIMNAMVEGILKEPTWAEYSYADKRSYFMDEVFPYYEEALNLTSNDVPIIPSESEVSNGNYSVRTPNDSSSYVAGGNPVQDQPLDSYVPEQAQQPVEPSDKLYSETVEDEFVDESQPEINQAPVHPQPEFQAVFPEETNLPPLNFGELLDETDEAEPQSEQAPWLTHEQLASTTMQNAEDIQTRSKHAKVDSTDLVSPEIPALGTTISAEVEFPRFEEDSFEKSSYEPFEKDYVAWQLNLKKHELNKQLKDKEQHNAQLANQALQQQVLAFQTEELNKINEKIKASDKRDSLKQAVLQETKKQELEELQRIEEELTAQKDSALEEERLRYEAAVKKIKLEYSQNLTQSKSDCQSRLVKSAQEDYQSRYYEETGKLQNLLQDELDQMEKRKALKQADIQQQLQKIGNQIGKQIYSKGEAALKASESNLITNYEYAKRAHLVDREEELNKQNHEQITEHAQQLKKEIEQLSEERVQSERELKELQQQILENKKKALDQQEAMILDFKQQNQLKKSIAG